MPPEGSCPPYALEAGQEQQGPEDVTPSLPAQGKRIEWTDLDRIGTYLPPEIWARRDVFFHEGMRLEIGPCHRRYDAPPFFRKSTRDNAGRAQLDEDGNLVGYRGDGLPFSPDSILDDAPDAGQRWAWNYRYRYMGAGFRGDFRIIHADLRKGTGDRYEGHLAWVPLHGVPGLPEQRPNGFRFAAAGRFEKPAIARGVAWRQLSPSDADGNYKRSDDLFVWIPEQRKVRRAPPQSVEGLFMPSYQRGQMGDESTLSLPGNSGSTRVPDSSLAVVEHQRRGFVGLWVRPNAYRFHLVRVQDVLAPINSNRFGFPSDPNRSYGPSGLSLATDRWELRRAVVLRGERRDPERKLSSATIYVDALTQQPLYFVTRGSRELIQEVGILMGRYSADDPLQPSWEGSGNGSGVILPVAASFWLAGRIGWLRESFELRADPPNAESFKDMTTTIWLRGGR
ncbi:MAG: DUF1329 domain-containing protein [Myxococcota bacterium]